MADRAVHKTHCGVPYVGLFYFIILFIIFQWVSKKSCGKYDYHNKSNALYVAVR